MKVIVPSYNRPMTIRTHIYAPECLIVVHNDEQRRAYLKNPTINPRNLIVSGAPLGISNQRQWILENLVADGDWFLTMDDNVSCITGVAPGLYPCHDLPVQEKGFDRRTYEHAYPVDQFLARCKEDIAFADKIGAAYTGFAVVDNYYFRAKKYRMVGYVISKAALIKRTRISYDPNVKAMDDYAFTAEQLLRRGTVLINNYLFPLAGHYEDGGIGTYESRVPKKIADCEYLMRKYPGLFRYKKKQGCHPKAELQVNFTTTKQVAAWRTQLLKTIGR